MNTVKAIKARIGLYYQTRRRGRGIMKDLGCVQYLCKKLKMTERGQPEMSNVITGSTVH
jgi:hypothetical protein